MQPFDTSKEGICWKCQGIDSASLVEGAISSDPSSPLRDQYTYAVSWCDIRQDCALCQEIKLVLRPSNSRLERMKLDRHHLDGGYIHGILDAIDGQKPRTWCLSMYVNVQETNIRVIHLVPHSVARHGDAELCDLSLAKSWLDECRSSHQKSCVYDHSSNIPLRVIDCDSKELCDISPGVPYVCLSYVWGNATDGDGDFRGLPKGLPKTIADSIWVTTQLGISYLWVDRYCIDQQNAAEKLRLITSMDRIYSGAALTIVAASDTDPYHGLQGVNGTPRSDLCSKLPEASIRGMVALENPGAEISQCVWQTRGWTFQELVLSRRRLVFTGSQLYYQCNTTQHIESLSSRFADQPSPGLAIVHDTLATQTALRAFDHLQTGNNSSMPNILYRQLEEYYTRHVKFSTDIITAFLGIIRAFEMRSGPHHIFATHLYGLPVFYDGESHTPKSMALKRRDCDDPRSTFANSLSWHIDWGIPDGVDMKFKRSSLFPSWSWASVKASLHPHTAGSLFLSCWDDVNHYQEELQAWVTDETGKRSCLEDYIRNTDQRHGKGIMPSIIIQSWTALCAASYNTDNQRDSTCHISGFSTKGVFVYLDYPQIRLDNDVIAVYLGSFDMAHAPGTIARRFMSILLAEKVDDLTWRRVGLLQGLAPKHSDVDDTQDCLNSLRPAGGWEQRVISLV